MSSLTTRTEQLAAEFAAVNADAIATVTGCTTAQWRQPCVNEGRSVGVVAHHIATVHHDFTGLLTALVAGQTRSPGSSMEQVHASNARHARDFATVGQSETLDLLRTNGAAVIQLLGRLDDEQLDRTAGVFGGNELSVARVVEWIVIGHAREHLASIRATIGE
jgi:hypothetical protein